METNRNVEENIDKDSEIKREQRKIEEKDVKFLQKRSWRQIENNRYLTRENDCTQKRIIKGDD